MGSKLATAKRFGGKLAGRGLWRLDENERACRNPASTNELAHKPSRLHIPGQSRALCRARVNGIPMSDAKDTLSSA